MNQPNNTHFKQETEKRGLVQNKSALNLHNNNKGILTNNTIINNNNKNNNRTSKLGTRTIPNS